MSSTADRIDAESQKDPARLEREIDQQREDISHIVDALENKLSPGQLFDRLISFGKGNGREFAQNVGTAVKTNPIPALLTSVGLLWLYASRNEYPPPAARGSYAGAGADDTGPGIADRARELGGQASDAWHDAKAHVADTASRLADTARETGASLEHQTDRVLQGYNQLLRDNPLVLGAIGVAVGALLGAALPPTEPENRLMGEASDRLAEQAKQAVRTGTEKMRDTMEDIGESPGAVRH